MRVLKVELEGVTTSFRYPHILIGRQPSYPLPPPATIYGHIASTLGEYPAPDSFRFAYTFTHQGSVDDYEHTWLIERDGRKAKKGQPEPNIVAGLSPTVREMLFRPRLTLYLDRPDWYNAFRTPAFPVLLGRSQDLAAYTRVEIVELEERTAGYFDHTLLPFDPWRPRVGLGHGLLMPRHVDPQDRQRVTWARYVALTNRAFLPLPGESGREPQLVRGMPQDFRVWVDPGTEERRGRQRALEWLSVNPGEGEALHVPA
ncbi:type I-B CRISPR-associated protein Cas5b [Deinococcus sp. YIM 77859]|uniref:type I-B CRISPR-associated protein Cas5b n=1 Tax=Deinococcus sp. YIM 77859 TaxID=1540221 RepID=UPI00068EC8C3|nr:type I-B CRISPR-associated protein Cas5b [Deinococcus sp. YIM 77859]